MVRKAGQADARRELGADETTVADLEGGIHATLEDGNAVVFTTGSGGHTGPENTGTVDRAGAIATFAKPVAHLLS